MTKTLATTNPKLWTLLEDLEKKAKMKVEQFDLRLAERAFGILNTLMMELDAKDKEEVKA